MPEAIAIWMFRALSASGCLTVFGTALFGAIVLPRAMAPAEAAQMRQALARPARIGLGVTIAATLAWLVMETVRLAKTAGVAETVSALPLVTFDTLFGRLIVGHIFLQTIALTVIHGSVRRWWAATLASGLAVAAFAGHGHGIATDGWVSWLFLSNVVHLLAVGAWLGGLPPLLYVVGRSPTGVAGAACRWFSPMGKLCVVALLVTAAFLFSSLIGGLPGLVGTPYGRVAGLKMGLLLVLIAFAAANRYWFAPALRSGEPAVARRTLLRSIGLQTAVGAIAFAAAAWLTALPPAIHEQPLWPFTLRPSLVAFNEPELAAELVPALIALGAAVTMMLVSFIVPRRFVLLPACCAAILLVWARPHLDLLFVEAWPTSYFQSPTGYTAQSVAQGAALYPLHCASCHGAEGRGDGPAAGNLPVRPADLTAEHLWDHADGELFWWISQGMESPSGGKAMPGFSRNLNAGQIWSLIDMIRSRNGKLAFQDAGFWTRPTRAPGFVATCPSGASVEIGTPTTGPVLIAMAPSAPPALPAGVIPVAIGAAGQVVPADWCATDDPVVREAYGIAISSQPAGWAVLVDSSGWLRRFWSPGEQPAWSDAARLAVEVDRIEREPLVAPTVGGHVHGQ